MIVASEVIREAWRDRWLAVGPASVVLLAPLAMGTRAIALGAGDKAAADTTLLAVWALTFVLAIVLGLSLRPRPDLVWMLVRPISRPRFHAERYLGAMVALAAQVGALHVAWVVAALIAGVEVPSLGASALLLWVEACVLAALAALLVQVLPPLPAGLGAAALGAVGHLADEYRALAAEGDVPVALARALFLAVPDLDRFDVQALVVHGVAPDPVQLVIAVGYGAAWCAALVLVATVVLERRDLP